MGNVEYRGFKPRIEGIVNIVKCTLSHCKILIIKIIKREVLVQGARFDPKPSQVGEKTQKEEKKYKKLC